jgi:hypothetical protein
MSMRWRYNAVRSDNVNRCATCYEHHFTNCVQIDIEDSQVCFIIQSIVAHACDLNLNLHLLGDGFLLSPYDFPFPTFAFVKAHRWICVAVSGVQYPTLFLRWVWETGVQVSDKPKSQRSILMLHLVQYQHQLGFFSRYDNIMVFLTSSIIISAQLSFLSIHGLVQWETWIVGLLVQSQRLP